MILIYLRKKINHLKQLSRNWINKNVMDDQDFQEVFILERVNLAVISEI